MSGATEELVLCEESFGFDPHEADILELDVPDFREQTGLSYPAVLLSNVLFVDCLKVLQSVKRPSYREMSIWVEMPNGAGYQEIGDLQMDSDILLLLRHLRICVTIYYDSEHMEVLNLDDPAVLEKFI